MIGRVGLSVAVVVGSLAVGWWLGRRVLPDRPPSGSRPLAISPAMRGSPLLTQALTGQVVRFVVKWLAPVVLCLALWQMDLRDPTLWLLPFLGVAVSTSSFLPAWLYVRRAGFTRPQQGSFYTCAFFSNLGYFGAFIAFVVLGEDAFGLATLYLAFFNVCFYTLGFSLARRFGHAKQPSDEASVRNDQLRFPPFVGMVLGIGLSLSGAGRPAALGILNHVLIPVETALFLIAIGSQMTFAWPRRLLRPCLVMSGIKFLYLPAIAWLLLNALGVTGPVRLVVLLEASTPVALSPMVLPLLFGLDRELSYTLWYVTTALAVPWFILALPVWQAL